MRPRLGFCAFLAASLLLSTEANASWPPEPGADLTNKSSWPNDPDYPSLWQLFSYLPRPAMGVAYLAADEMLGASGMSIDKAWESTVGSSSVRIVVLDSGIEWDELDLVDQVWLNPGELRGPDKMPKTASGGVCGGTGALQGYDCNGDGVFSVADYANDPRITPTVPGQTCTDPSTGDTKALTAGDKNHNCLLDPGDLIAIFSDGVDDDANGYTDDIAGWDFFADDNDPYDDLRSGHGTTVALQAAAAGNNGVEGIGVCPSCRVVPLRVGDSSVVDSSDLAKGLVYLADASSGGAMVALAAVSAINMTAYARAAVDYAYGKGVVVVASMGDENARHHVEPASGEHVLAVHGIGLNDSSLTTSTSFLDYDNCTNFGGQLVLSASSAGCSDEATARTAGILGLVQAAAAASARPRGLSAEEQIQLAKMTADVVNVPQSRESGSGLYESLSGFSQRFGYGRPNAAAAVAAVATGLIPPEVDILSPAWFSTLYASGTAGPVPVVGRVVAARALSYDVTVDWAPGVEPQASDFVALAAPVENVPGQTVSGADTSPLALLDPSAISSVHTADPDSPMHENDRTITIRVQAVAHYANGDVTGEARRSVAIVNEDNGLDRTLLPGFPVALSGSSEGGVKLVDIDGDGVRDIVLMTNDGYLHAISAKGGLPRDLPGFPYALAPVDGLSPSAPDPTLPSYLTAPAYVAGSNGGVDATTARESVDGAPAIGPVTGASDMIVFVSWAGTVYVVDRTGHDSSGFPLRLPRVPSCPEDPTTPRPAGDCMDTQHDLARGAFASPVLADMDGDGTLDIIIAAFDGNVYAFHGDGSSVSGFPVRVHASSSSRYDRVMTTPAVADFNGDGVPDLLVGTSETVSNDSDVGYYFVIDGRGTNAPSPYLVNWPVEVPTIYFAPITGIGTSASPAILPLSGSSATDALLQVAGSPVVVPPNPGDKTAPPLLSRASRWQMPRCPASRRPDRSARFPVRARTRCSRCSATPLSVTWIKMAYRTS